MVQSALEPKVARLEARIKPETKALIEQAAALENCSMTEFVVKAVEAAAINALERHGVIVLSPRDSAVFVNALLNPPELTEQMEADARAYRAFVGQQP